MLSAFAFMALYIALLGVAALLEQPIAHHLDALQLDALLRIGAAFLAVVVLLILSGPDLPGWTPALAGVGIGLISGSGSLCYCIALDRLPADLAACLANGYLVVTVALGIIVLHDPLTLFTLAGLVLTIGGAVALSIRSGSGRAATASDSATGGGTRFALVASPSFSSHSAASASSGRARGIVWLTGYVALIGVGAFLEKPALQQLAPLQLNALTAFGMVIAGLIALGVVRASRRHRHHSSRLGAHPMRLPALGIGLMIGTGSIFYYLALAHLPVSIAAALANAYVLVTVVLAVLVFHQPMTWNKAAGVVAMLAGVVLLSLRVPL